MRDPILRGPKEYTEGGRKYRITAKGGLHHLRGNARPYFSITADIDRWSSYRWQEDSGGCLHDDILKHWPELADLVALHLSDDDGVPMHAAENGWYFMAGALPEIGVQYHLGSGEHAKSPTECLQVFAKHVRIKLDEAAALRDELVKVIDAVPHYGRVYERAAIRPAKEALKAWCEQQRPRWKAEAQACVAKHNLQVYGS
jgi:hypothetical protein